MKFSSMVVRGVLFCFVAVSAASVVVGCESKEDNDILSAQLCFNDLGDSAAGNDAKIDACLDKIAGIDNNDANTIRCSAEFLRGGLTTTKIITAFDGYKSQAKAAQEAYLVDQLALTPATAADAAYTYCKKTETAGLAYIATLARLGTKIKELGNTGNIQTDIQACAATPGQCDDASVGEMVSDMADLYCKGDAVNQQICIDIASAEAAANGDYAALAQALYAQISY